MTLNDWGEEMGGDNEFSHGQDRDTLRSKLACNNRLFIDITVLILNYI